MNNKTCIAFFFLLLILVLQIDCNDKTKGDKNQSAKDQQNPQQSHAYFGGGCFWCVEAMFEDMKGVSSVESGYSGGFVENPIYKEVKKGVTGHAEVIKITYDPKIISFKELLYIFMHAHNPTTYHRQGIDSGSQYRSVIYYQTEQELRATKSVLREIQEQGTYTGYPEAILTEVGFFGKFYPAESYHQNYFSQNPYDQECSSIIAPKVQKMRKLFKNYYEDEL